MTHPQTHPAHATVQETLSAVEASVRGEPDNPAHRWALVELLCLLGQWERALKQLQTLVRLDPSKQQMALLVRGLIRAEHQRVEVFGGNLLPAPVVERPEWMDQLAQAIRCNGQGDHAQADTLRQAALDQAPSPSGEVELAVPLAQADASTPLLDGAEPLQTLAFDWIADSDSRLGPVCEVMVAGGYRWLAYADIARIDLPAPTNMLDLVWRTATITLHHNKQKPLRVFVPTRYSGTEDVAAEAGSAQRDALMMARLTVWEDVGETGVFALGQKTLLSSAADLPLLDVRHLRLNAVAP